MQIPNLGRLSLRPVIARIGAGQQSKRPRVTGPARVSVDALWKRIQAKVDAMGGALASWLLQFINQANNDHPGIIQDVDGTLMVNASVFGHNTVTDDDENWKAALAYLTELEAQINEAAAARNQPTTLPRRRGSRPVHPNQLARQQNAQQSEHMEDDQGDAMPAHFKNADNFTDPAPWPSEGNRTAIQDEEKRDLENKWHPANKFLARLKEKPQDDPGCCSKLDEE